MTRTTVAAITSHVMRGAVGLRPVGFALERRGATVWKIPTVLLPWHPGLGRSARTVPAEFSAQLDDLATRAGEIDAVLTGYFATAEQVVATARFIDAVRAVRPDAPILVDPVTGDEEGRYVPDAVAEAIAAELLPRADIATPNANELRDLGDGGDVIGAARRLGPARVIVTSAPNATGTGAMLVTATHAVVAEHEAVRVAPRGTGDLFSAVYLSAVLAGRADEVALREAAAATLAAIKASSDDLLALGEVEAAIAVPPVDCVTLRPA